MTTLQEALNQLALELPPNASEEWKQHCLSLFERWLTRGDGVAVYRNEALDSANAGHKQFVSFGSNNATLETDAQGLDLPPKRLPDFPNQINWAYQLFKAIRLSEEPEPLSGDAYWESIAPRVE